MTPEYSSHQSGGFAWRFDPGEQEAVVEGLKLLLKKKNFPRQIDKVRNHPKNEGQATYSCMIDNIRNEQSIIEEMIRLLQ